MMRSKPLFARNLLQRFDRRVDRGILNICVSRFSICRTTMSESSFEASFHKLQKRPMNCRRSYRLPPSGAGALAATVPGENSGTVPEDDFTPPLSLIAHPALNSRAGRRNCGKISSGELFFSRTDTILQKVRNQQTSKMWSRIAS